ncbi:MAG: hypothetical protein MZV70_22675 [Desulfobacterales bacterium]|nr:hypothetical protein [Desulfobacterales bacterium]
MRRKGLSHGHSHGTDLHIKPKAILRRPRSRPQSGGVQGFLCRGRVHLALLVPHQHGFLEARPSREVVRRAEVGACPVLGARYSPLRPSPRVRDGAGERRAAIERAAVSIREVLEECSPDTVLAS